MGSLQSLFCGSPVEAPVLARCRWRGSVTEPRPNRAVHDINRPVIKPSKSPYLVPFDGSFNLSKALTAPPAKELEKDQKKKLKKRVGKIAELQRALYASDDFSLLLVFQAMDAAGKDGTVRAVTSGINPAGFQVYSFKQPSSEELDHDFLWRSNRSLPERGRSAGSGSTKFLSKRDRSLEAPSRASKSIRRPLRGKSSGSTPVPRAMIVAPRPNKSVAGVASPCSCSGAI